MTDRERPREVPTRTHKWRRGSFGFELVCSNGCRTSWQLDLREPKTACEPGLDQAVAS